MKYLATIFAVCFAVTCFGQAPQSFNYQAVVRDADNKPVTNETVDFTIAILQDGEVIYEEEHLNEDTGELGLVNFKVGEGTNPSTDFSAIDWRAGQLEVKVYLDGEEMGSVDLVAVPYALYAETAETDDDWSNTGDSVLSVMNAKVGIGTSTPQYPLHVVGEKFKLDGSDDADIELNIPSTSLSSPELRFSLDGETEGIVQLRHTESFLLVNENLSSTPTSMVLKDGKVGINTLSPSDELEVRGLLRITGVDANQKLRMYSSSASLDNLITSYDENNDRMWVLNMGDRSQGDAFAIDRPGNGVNEFYIDVNGRTHVRTLQIHGGSDINEDVNSESPLQPGDVVVIDTQNEGQVCHTTQAYDSKVAGVISGANGVKPGLSLSQEDVLEGDYPLAMLGRVYVKVTGKVAAADLLTTSEIPGYAMAVKGEDAPRGSVIGKAMTSNDGGIGMVLLLVQPQ